jgi:hypothetical protein
MWERPLSISTTAIVLTASCGPGCIGERLIWVGAQIRQRAPFKIVECMRRSILEWIIGDEAIADIVLLLADDATELERKGRWDRDGARDRLVIVRHLSRSRGRQDSANDVASIIATHASGPLITRVQ